MSRFHTSLLLLAVLAVALTGCGSGDNDTSQGLVSDAKDSSGAPATEGFAVKVAPDKQSVRIVAEGSPQAGLRVLLDKAYDADNEATGSVVSDWLGEREILSAENIRDLLAASWQRDEKATAAVIKPWFMAHSSSLDVKDVPTLLDKAWGHDANGTRTALRTWGANYGFVDISDKDALIKNDLIRGTDLAQVKKAIETHHKDNWNELLGMAKNMRSTEDLTNVPVSISWASASKIGRGVLRFSESDENFVEYVNTVVTLAPANTPEHGIPVVIEYAVNMPSGRVQVQDGDFVTIVCKLKEVEAPDEGTKEWRRILRLGVISGSVYL